MLPKVVEQLTRGVFLIRGAVGRKTRCHRIDIPQTSLDRPDKQLPDRAHGLAADLPGIQRRCDDLDRGPYYRGHNFQR